jgi:hypothetical protein
MNDGEPSLGSNSLRSRVRRGLDAATGAALLGFSAKLATEHG